MTALDATTLDATTNQAVIVIAHGSRSEEATRAHRDTCSELATRTGLSVSPAYLELAEPSLPDAVAELADRGVDNIVVLPLFLYPGRHMQRDIPALMAEAAEAHPELQLRLGPLFGSDPGVIDLLAAQIGS